MASGRLIIPGYMPAQDDNGDPIPGAKMFTYENGTTVPLVTYTTASRTTALPNPIVADAGGSWPAIWVDENDTYSVTVANSDSAPIVSYDNVTPSNDANTAAAVLAENAAQGALAAEADAEQFAVNADASADAAAASAAQALAAAAGMSATPALTSIGVLSPLADRIPMYTGPTSATLLSISPYMQATLTTPNGAALAATLSLGTMSSQNSNNVLITGGNVNAIVGGGTPMAGTFTALAGDNLQFPVTAVPSADPRNLDDYQELSPTPTLSAATTPPTGVTYNAGGTTLRGTKVGRLQHFQVRVQAPNIGSGGVGNVRIVLTGLPNAAVATGFSVSVCDFFSIGAGSVPTVTMAAGGNILELRAQSNTANTAVTYSSISNGFTIIVNGSYVAA